MTYGDIRDTLVALPHHPWPDHANGAHYVTSDIFPVKHELLVAFADSLEDWEKPSSIFEIGALCGYFLVTALDALTKAGCHVGHIGWIDPETALPGSNVMVVENLAAATETRIANLSSSHADLSRPGGGWTDLSWKASVADVLEVVQVWDDVHADVVHVDGDHSYAACLVDLGVAIALEPKIILVDDYQALGEVRSATDDFARQMGLTVEEVTTVNGLAVIQP